MKNSKFDNTYQPCTGSFKEFDFVNYILVDTRLSPKHFFLFSVSLLALLKDQIGKELEKEQVIKNLTEAGEKAKDQIKQLRNETKAATESLQQKDEILARKDEEIKMLKGSAMTIVEFYGISFEIQ